MNRRDKLLRRLRIPACAVLVSLAVGCRGWVIARMTGGRYPVSSLLVDTLAFAAILAALHGLDIGLRAGLRRAFGASTRSRRALTYGFRLLVLVLVVGPFLLVTLQLHPPRIRCVENPMSLGMQFSEVTLASDGRRLSAWDIPGTEESAPIVLIAHGLNANKANFLPAAAILYDHGYSVFMFDFRGHGDSEGRTITLGYRESEDVKAAYDWIVKAHPGRRVYALGFSMGGTAVVRAAAVHGIFEKIALDSTFARVEDVARGRILKYLGPLSAPVWHAGRFWAWAWSGVDLDDHRPVECIPALARKPLMFIHGTADGVIPCSQSEALAKASGGRGALWLVPGMDHVESMADAEAYGKRLEEFFGKGE